MHSALVQELVDLRRRDTEVSVPVLRKHRLRAAPPAEERIASETVDSNAIAGEWADPGDTLAAARAIQVILREAVVRRNHRLEGRGGGAVPIRRLERGAESNPVPKGCVEIDWARSSDPALVVKRIGRGAIRIEGSSSCARVSIGIDGLAFTVKSGGRDAIAARLSTHYCVEIVEESPLSAVLVLVAPRSHS
jgi:hypothetical protein